jgi:hypothetical protein
MHQKTACNGECGAASLGVVWFDCYGIAVTASSSLVISFHNMVCERHWFFEFWRMWHLNQFSISISTNLVPSPSHATHVGCAVECISTGTWFFSGYWTVAINGVAFLSISVSNDMSAYQLQVGIIVLLVRNTYPNRPIAIDTDSTLLVDNNVFSARNAAIFWRLVLRLAP